MGKLFLRTRSSSNAFVTLSGTIFNSSELDIVSGGLTLIYTLTGDTWDSTIGQDNAKTTALLAGISAPIYDTVKSAVTYTNVVRTSSTVVTITFPALATYGSTSKESLIVVIPSACTNTNGGDIVNMQSPTIYSVLDHYGAYRFDFYTNLYQIKSDFKKVTNGTQFTDFFTAANYSNVIRLANPAGTNVWDSALKANKNATGNLYAKFKNYLSTQTITVIGDFSFTMKITYKDNTTSAMNIFTDSTYLASSAIYGKTGNMNLVINSITYSVAVGAPVDGTDYILTFTRSGTTVKTYLDGVLKLTTTATSANLSLDNIGTYFSDVPYQRGYIKFWLMNTVAKTQTEITRMVSEINTITA